MRPVTCRKGAVSMLRLFGSWLYLMFPEIMVLGSVLERFIQCAEKRPMYIQAFDSHVQVNPGSGI